MQLVQALEFMLDASWPQPTLPAQGEHPRLMFGSNFAPWTVMGSAVPASQSRHPFGLVTSPPFPQRGA